MQGGERDPATPWFEAEQDRVPDSPRGRVPDEHPLRRALRHVRFPSSRDAIVRVVADADDVTSAQAAWLATTLPDASYASEDEVVEALGRWGPPPPAFGGPR